MSSRYYLVLHSLLPFLATNNYYSYGGKKTGNAQRYKRQLTLKQAFRQLRDSKYRLNNVNKFKERHFIFLFKKWIDGGLSASSIQYRSSVLRIFSNAWLNKPGMIKSTLHYGKDNINRVKRIAAATRSLCWSDNNVNPAEVISNIAKYDQRVALQLELQLYFKLRKKESFLLKPHLDDYEKLLYVRYGTKGGRQRIVEIKTKKQRELIDKAKSMTRLKNGSLIPSGKSLKQWASRYDYVLKKFGVNKKVLGVTSHGLRHEGSNNRYEEIVSEKSPVRGGILSYDKKELDNYARDIISQELGHARRSITSGYLGAQKLKKQK